MNEARVIGAVRDTGEVQLFGLDYVFECPITMDLMTTPVYLDCPCFARFDKSSMDALIAMMDKDGTLVKNCPTCRQEFTAYTVDEELMARIDDHHKALDAPRTKKAQQRRVKKKKQKAHKERKQHPYLCVEMTDTDTRYFVSLKYCSCPDFACGECQHTQRLRELICKCFV
jgi:hypothetical protein